MLSFPNNYFDTYLPEGASHAEGEVHSVPKESRTPKEELSSSVVYTYEGYHGISDRVFDWVKLHDDTPVDQTTRVSPRSVAEKVAKAVTFIPFKTFKKELISSYNDILAKVKPLYSSRGTPFNSLDDLIVLVEGNKSNKWAAELVRHETDDNPFAYIRLGSKDAVEFGQFLEQLPKAREAAVKAQFQDKVLMLFDDGSYSGKQISDHVKAILQLIKKHKLNPKAIAVVIPYMTLYALTRLQTIAQTAPQSCQVYISTHNQIVTLHQLTRANPNLTGPALALAKKVEAVERKLLADMWYKGQQSFLETIGLIWGIAGTKVPNSQSFPIAIANGSIMNAQGVPIKTSIRLVPENGPCYKKELGRPVNPIQNCHRVGVLGLYRGAQPTVTGIDELKKAGIKVIVRLREKPEENLDLIRQSGIEHVHIPFDYDKPSERLIVEFFVAIRKYKNDRKFVHCYHGADRTGVASAAAKAIAHYSHSKDGAAAKAAGLEDMLNPVYGFHRLTHSNLIDFFKSLDLDRIIANVKSIEQPAIPHELQLNEEEQAMEGEQLDQTSA